MPEADHHFVVRDDGKSIVYGPTGPDADSWTLSVGAEGDEYIELELGEAAMYELWTEVHNTPWPTSLQTTGKMRREIVERIEGAGAETLRDVLTLLEDLQGGGDG